MADTWLPLRGPNERGMSPKACPVPATKRCPKCGTTKPVAGFNTHKNRYDGLQVNCKACRQTPEARERQRETNARARANGNHLKYLYGIDKATYDEMMSAQDGLCARPGCHKAAVCVDHDHSTGKVRGILCRTCNSGIGHLGDTLADVLAAADYLMGAQ